MRTLTIAVFLGLAAMPALGHEWYTGRTNEAGAGCCGGQDCGPIDPAAVEMVTPTHWRITLSPGSIPTWSGSKIGEIVVDFHGNPGLSPDHQFHVCATVGDLSAGVARCLFVGGST